jgi:hypothetical protein
MSSPHSQNSKRVPCKAPHQITYIPCRESLYIPSIFIAFFRYRLTKMFTVQSSHPLMPSLDDPIQPLIARRDRDVAATYIVDILDIYTALARLPALDPCSEVNSLFGRLVGICAQILDEVTTAKVTFALYCWMRINLTGK